MAKSQFYEEMRNATIERQVEDVYNKGICLYFPTHTGIEYPFACDGFLDTKTDNGKVIKLIIEYKFNETLTNAVSRAKILVQVIFYIKRFEQNGFILPNVCLVGDKDECFVMHTNSLLPYLDEEVDWSVSPSKAHENNPDLVMKVAQDTNINPFIFMVDEHFQFKTVADKIKDLADNIQRYVRVTEHNLSKIFDYFCRNVLRNKSKLSGHDLVEIFMGVIGDKMNYYQHPVNDNILVCHGKHISMDGKAFKAFFGYFDRTYTPQETMRLNGIADRLIEDVDRRMKGDFWTPTLFVDYAHKMIEELLGYDWKERFVVWDNCWGTGNLTRDYKFGELYCSTLFQSELNIGADYNPEATKFQFDFLNDSIPMTGEMLTGQTKIPQGLLEALQENKPIVFFLNPPYGRAGKDETGSGASGILKGGANSMVNTQMKADNMGACSANLYAQFLYKIMKVKQAYKLTDCYIAVYCPTLFLAGQSFKLFRSALLKEFVFCDAFQFKASEFADVSDSWGIGFTILKSIEMECRGADETCRAQATNLYAGGTPTPRQTAGEPSTPQAIGEPPTSQDKESFRYGIAESNGEEIKITGYKTVYNADNNAVTRCSEHVASNKKRDNIFPTLSNALNIVEKDGVKVSNEFLGTLLIDGNTIDTNPQGVSIFSAVGKKGANHVVAIETDNFPRCVSLFAARRLIQKNWINWADEYLAPNENHPLFNEFVHDSIVYSLFESKSNQSSLRNIEYKGKVWNIVNEFFWMSKEEITQLANDNNCPLTYNDARTSKERYVYQLLQTLIPETIADEACRDAGDAGDKLSPEAQAVLNKASDIVRKTFKYRPLFDSEHPEYQILNWDCGWYQIKALAKEYAKSDYAAFTELFKNLANKMRPIVYELEFLK